MKNKLTIILLSIFIGYSFTSCNNSTEQQQDKKSEAKMKVSEEEPKKNTGSNNLCFRNEYPFQDNPSMKDIEEFSIHIDGKKVTGTYSWLPAQKDQRIGSFTGTIKDKTITAQYHSVQEGTETDSKLTIILHEEKVEIIGETNLGFDATIAKVECDK